MLEIAAYPTEAAHANEVDVITVTPEHRKLVKTIVVCSYAG